MRLEKDIENAKQCLLNIKNIPSDLSVADFRLEAGDCGLKYKLMCGFIFEL